MAPMKCEWSRTHQISTRRKDHPRKGSWQLKQGLVPVSDTIHSDKVWRGPREAWEVSCLVTVRDRFWRWKSNRRKWILHLESVCVKETRIYIWSVELRGRERSNKAFQYIGDLNLIEDRNKKLQWIKERINPMEIWIIIEKEEAISRKYQSSGD